MKPKSNYPTSIHSKNEIPEKNKKMPLKVDKSFICSVLEQKKQNPFPDIFSIQIPIFHDWFQKKYF